MSERTLTTLAEVRQVLRADNPWIASEDIDGELVVTIARVLEHEDAPFEDGKRTVVAVHFSDHDKALILNKTNTDVLIDLLGTDVADWTGKKITLRRVQLAQKAFGRSYGVRVKG